MALSTHKHTELTITKWRHISAVWLSHTLQWRHNGRNSVSNHQPRDCLPWCLIRRRSKKTSKLRFTGLCVGNSPETGEFPAQRASNAENVSIWWRHHGLLSYLHWTLKTLCWLMGYLCWQQWINTAFYIKKIEAHEKSPIANISPLE